MNSYPVKCLYCVLCAFHRFVTSRSSDTHEAVVKGHADRLETLGLCVHVHVHVQ